jgi:hypothetical protein
MFDWFKKSRIQSDQLGAHLHHREFARRCIPGLLTRQRGGFLFAMTGPDGSSMLQKSWENLGAEILPPKSRLSPDGLSISAFRHNDCMCIFVVFPAPMSSGESYFGLIVAGPSTDWSPEARAKLAVRYFLLERSASNKPEIFEWRQPSSQDEEVFDSLGVGPPPDMPPEFADAILSRFYGYNPEKPGS